MKFLRFTQTGAVALFAALMLFASSQVWAQTFTLTSLNGYSCSNAVYGTNGSYFSGNSTYPSRGSYTGACTTNNTSNSSGSVVTAVQTLRAATAQTVGLISSRISAVNTAANSPSGITAMSMDEERRNGELGLAAGAGENGIGVWLQGKYTYVDYNETAVAYDGNLMTGMIGIDKQLLNNQLLVGVAIGYEVTDLDTTFNRGTIEADGYLVAPYVSFKFTKELSLDATVGYGSISYDQTRLDPVTSEKFSSSTDADRLFGSAVLSYNRPIEKWRLGGEAGALYTHESRDAFTERGTTGTTVQVGEQSTHLGQALLGAKVGYSFGSFEPYVLARGEFDFAKTNDPRVAANQIQPQDSDFGLRLGLGANIQLSPAVSAFIEGTTVQFRDEYDEYTGIIRLRAEF